MDNAKVVVLEFLMPPCGSTSQLSWGHPVHEVFVVRLYYKGFFGPNEVGPPVVYRFDHPKELEVVSVIVLFGRGERGRVVSYWVASSWGSWPHSFVLGEDSPNSIL